MANISGGSGNDILLGTELSDTIDGGLGNDAMSGLGGNDTYIVDSYGDEVNEYAGEGIDLVRSSVSYWLSANVENLTLTGTAYYGLGNELNNVITGNAADNYLSGGDGADNLSGGDGNDVLSGDRGDDVMIGGLGDDEYFVDSARDQVLEGAGGGHDVVFSAVSFSLAALSNVEDLEALGSGDINLTGNAQSNLLWGNDGDNILDGGAGADEMYGGAGNDDYYIDNVGDRVVEGLEGGTDSVVSTIALTTAIWGVENYTFNTSAAVHFTTGDDDNRIIGGTGADVITSGGGNDAIEGNAGDDNLNGGTGNDEIDGGTGSDVMAGGVGDDAYGVDSIGDVVIETSGLVGGFDLVYSTISIKGLWDSVEAAQLLGAGNLNVNGNTSDNMLLGNIGNNIINGADGDDTIQGSRGNDTVSGGLGHDSFYFDIAGNDGRDVIREFEHSNDQLWFQGVTDGNRDGALNFNDILLDVSGVVDHGAGADVAVSFNSGTAITFTGAGTGHVSSLLDLVEATTQLQVAHT